MKKLFRLPINHYQKISVIPTEAADGFIVRHVVEGLPNFAFAVASSCPASPPRQAPKPPKPAPIQLMRVAYQLHPIRYTGYGDQKSLGNRRGFLIERKEETTISHLTSRL
jgi:hypothetical protein